MAQKRKSPYEHAKRQKELEKKRKKQEKEKQKAGQKDRASLETLYNNASYRVLVGEDRWLPIPVGESSQELDEFLDRVGAENFCLITAWNPGSLPQEPEQNEDQQQLLQEQLKDYEGILPAFSDGEDWEGEQMLFVPNIEVAVALTLAIEFKQTGVLYGKRGAEIMVVMVE